MQKTKPISTLLFMSLLLFGCDQTEPTTPASFANASAGQIVSTPSSTRVIDADTIELSGVRVRLSGIAAPERGHPTFGAGQAFVKSLVNSSNSVVCSLTGERTYDREVGTCEVVKSNGNRIDMQAAVVGAGLARDCRRYSGGRYGRFETAQSRALPLPGYCS